MTQSATLPRLQKLAAETFGCAPEQLRETTVAGDIPNWDSLRHLVFVSGVEQEFGIEFDINEIANLTNVGDLIMAIERHTK